MIRDSRVLQDDFIPSEVEHREGKVTELSNALDPVLRGETGEDVFLYGPSGAGKTCLGRFVVDRLGDETDGV